MALLSNYKSGGTSPYMEYAWVTTLSADLQAAPPNNYTLCTLNTEIIDTNNYGTLANNLVTIPQGRYAYEFFASIRSPSSNQSSLVGITASNLTQLLVGCQAPNAFGNYMSTFNPSGMFNIDTTTSIGLVVAQAQYETGYIGAASVHIPGTSQANGVNYYGSAYWLGPNQTGSSKRTTLKLWKLQ